MDVTPDQKHNSKRHAKLNDDGAVARSAVRHGTEIGAKVFGLDKARLALDRMPIGCVINDLESRFVYWNPAAERIFGYKSEDVLGRQPFGNIVPSESEDQVKEIFRDLASGKIRDNIKTNNRTKDGRFITVEWFNTPLYDRKGNFLGSLSMCQDVTEAEKSREELAKRESAIRRITSAVPGVVYQVRVDPQSDIKLNYISGKVMEIFGITAEEALSDMALMRRHYVKEDREAMQQEFQRCAKLGKPFHYEFRVIDQSGQVKWVRSVATMEPGDKPGEQIWTGVTIDISDHKALEANLLQAQKMESVGRLAGGIAHDFNNLLTVILGYTEAIKEEMLAAGKPCSNQLERIERVHGAAERASDLTQQLLSFSRKDHVKPTIIELNQFIHEAAAIYDRLISRNISIQVLESSDPLTIRMDRGQLNQVVLNLVVNARDAMPSGGQLIISVEKIGELPLSLNAEQHSAQGSYARLSVVDTGLGMDESTLSRVFEPFFTTKGVGEGTGLGLFTVFGIVKQGGGHIEVQSKPGEGSSFSIYLPIVTVDSVAQKPSSQAEDKPQFVSEKGPVLVVEDEIPVLRLIEESLRGAGFDVITAKNGEDALEAIAKNNVSPKILVTDIMMPQMGGLELVRHLKARLPQIKIVYTSGYAPGASAEVFASQNARFVPKPFTAKNLIEQVRAALQV